MIEVLKSKSMYAPPGNRVRYESKTKHGYTFSQLFLAIEKSASSDINLYVPGLEIYILNTRPIVHANSMHNKYSFNNRSTHASFYLYVQCRKIIKFSMLSIYLTREQQKCIHTVAKSRSFFSTGLYNLQYSICIGNFELYTSRNFPRFQNNVHLAACMHARTFNIKV